MHDILTWVEWAAVGVEIFGVMVIVMGAIYASLTVITIQWQRHAAGEAYSRFRHLFGKTLLLGLEILVAADIIRTVALDATLQSVLVLGLLVLIRTFLSWSLVVELEGHWPWQKFAAQRRDAAVTFRDCPETPRRQAGEGQG
jgi:uncharacterized membrane protein